MKMSALMRLTTGIVMATLMCLGGVVTAMADDSLILVGNKASLECARSFTDFLVSLDIPVKEVCARDFEKYKSEKYIIILGGSQKESEGLGDVIRRLLTKEDLEWITESGNRKMYIQHDVFGQGQFIVVFAGSDIEAAARCRKGNREKWQGLISQWFEIDSPQRLMQY